MKRIVCKSKQETIEALQTINPSVIAFDTETNQLSWYGQVVQGISFTDGKTAIYIQNPHDYKEELQNFFSKNSVLIAHNIVFDAKALLHLGINVFDKLWFDTMVAEHLLDEREEKGLKKLARKYLGVDTVDYEDAAKYGLESKEFSEYALNDAQWTWEILQKQKTLLENRGVVPLFVDIEMPFLKALAEMETNGIKVDKNKVLEKTLRVEQQKINKELEFLRAIGVKAHVQMTFEGLPSVVSSFDINSPQHLRELLFNKYKLSPPGKTPGGLPTTNGKMLEVMKDAHPVIPTLLEYRKMAKLHTAFLKPLPEHINADGRVRSSFNNCGTRTGRISSNNPNLQQLPRPDNDPLQIRTLFEASDGYSMISCDFSGQETAVMAHVSNDESLIEILRQGKDMHLAVAKQFFKLPIPEECLYKKHPEFKEYKEKYDSERTKAKMITFGLAYGKSAFGFAQDFKITEEEAQGILDKYFAGFPKVKKAIDEAKKLVQKQGFVVSMTGRRRHFDKNEQGYYPNSAYREAFNFLIQGYSADMIRLATISVREKAKLYKHWNLRLLATVHDENVYEVKKEYLEEACSMIKDCFEKAVTLKVPVSSSLGIGANYGEAK